MAWVVNREFDRSRLYCYQLFADAAASDQDIIQKVLSDLGSAFGLELKQEQRQMSCFVLSSVKGQKPVGTTNKGYSIKSLIGMLNYSVEWGPDLPVFLNETDQSYYLPERPSNKTLDTWRADPGKLKKVLEQIGLTISKENREVEVLVISPSDDKKGKGLTQNAMRYE